MDRSGASRAGMPWTAEEDRALRKALQTGASLAALARTHQRTEVAIRMRAMLYASELVDDGKLTMEEASRRLGVAVAEFERFRRERKGRDRDYMPILEEIRDLLRTLVARKGA